MAWWVESAHQAIDVWWPSGTHQNYITKAPLWYPLSVYLWSNSDAFVNAVKWWFTSTSGFDPLYLEEAKITHRRQKPPFCMQAKETQWRIKDIAHLPCLEGALALIPDPPSYTLHTWTVKGGVAHAPILDPPMKLYRSLVLIWMTSATFWKILISCRIKMND